MKKTTTIIKYTAITIVVIIIGLISYVRFVLPNVGKPEDLKAIYAYLRTVTPVNNKVEKFTGVQN